MAFSGSVLTGVDSFIFGWHDCLHDIPSTCGGLEWEMLTFLEFGRCDTTLGPTTWKALGKSVDKMQPKNEGKSRRTKRPRSLIMSSFFFHISHPRCGTHMAFGLEHACTSSFLPT